MTNNTSEVPPTGSEILHESRLTRVQVGILVFGFFAYLLEGYDILVISFAAPSIVEEWNVPLEQLGIVFSAGLLGITLGSMFIGGLADVYGRRILVSCALVVSGVATSAAVVVSDITQLMIVRFIAGLAIGALVVSLPSLVSEFSPRRHRTLILSILFSASSLGSVFGGFISASVIESIGWRQLFFIAGMATAGLGLIAYLFVPETIPFIARRSPESAVERVNKVLRYLGHKPIDGLPPADVGDVREPASLRSLFKTGRVWTTILMWVAFFFGYAAVYFIVSWVPLIIRELGGSHEQAIQGGVLVALGGMVSTLIIGLLGRWWSLSGVVTLAFCLAAGFVVVFAMTMEGFGSTAMVLSWLLLFGIGMTLMGGFANLYTVVLTVYPPQIRNTGLGWCSGIGRAGAVASPAVAGYLIAMGVSLSTVFLCFAVPVIIAAICVGFVRMKELP